MDEKKTQKLIPNSTQIPNDILDFLKPRIPEAECRCIDYICRRTFGFKKEEDRISLSQFVDGICDKNGVRLDYGTGLSRPSVVEALKNLIQSQAIFVRNSTIGNLYALNLDMDIEGVVKKVNQLRRRPKNHSKQARLFKVVKKVNQLSSLTESGKESEPISVKKVNPQYQGYQGNKEIPCGDVDNPVDKKAKAEQHLAVSDQMKFEYDKTFGPLRAEKRPRFSLIMKFVYDKRIGKDEVIRVLGNLREAKNFFEIRDFEPYLATMCKPKEEAIA